MIRKYSFRVLFQLIANTSRQNGIGIPGNDKSGTVNYSTQLARLRSEILYIAT